MLKEHVGEKIDYRVSSNGSQLLKYDRHDKKDFNLSKNTFHTNARVPIHGTRTHLVPTSSVLASKADGHKYYDEPEVTVEAKIFERHFRNVDSDMLGDAIIEEIINDKLKQWQKEDEQFFGHPIQEELALERNKTNATVISKMLKKQMAEWNDEKLNNTVLRKRRSLGMSEDRQYGSRGQYIETLNQNHLSSGKVQPLHKKSLFVNKIFSSKNKKEKPTKDFKPMKHGVHLDLEKKNNVKAKHKHKRVTKLNDKNRDHFPKNKGTESHTDKNVHIRVSSKNLKSQKEPVFQHQEGERHVLWTNQYDETHAPNIHHHIKKQQSPHNSRKQKQNLQHQHFKEKHESRKYPDIAKLRSHDNHQPQAYKPHHHHLDKKQVSKDNHHKKKHNSLYHLPKEIELPEKEIYREEYQENGNQQDSVERHLNREEKQLGGAIDEHPIIRNKAMKHLQKIETLLGSNGKKAPPKYQSNNHATHGGPLPIDFLRKVKRKPLRYHWHLPGERHASRDHRRDKKHSDGHFHGVRKFKNNHKREDTGQNVLLQKELQLKHAITEFQLIKNELPKLLQKVSAALAEAEHTKYSSNEKHIDGKTVRGNRLRRDLEIFSNLTRHKVSDINDMMFSWKSEKQDNKTALGTLFSVVPPFVKHFQNKSNATRLKKLIRIKKIDRNTPLINMVRNLGDTENGEIPLWKIYHARKINFTQKIQNEEEQIPNSTEKNNFALKRKKRDLIETDDKYLEKSTDENSSEAEPTNDVDNDLSNIGVLMIKINELTYKLVKNWQYLKDYFDIPKKIHETQDQSELELNEDKPDSAEVKLIDLRQPPSYEIQSVNSGNSGVERGEDKARGKNTNHDNKIIAIQDFENINDDDSYDDERHQQNSLSEDVFDDLRENTNNKNTKINYIHSTENYHMRPLNVETIQNNEVSTLDNDGVFITKHEDNDEDFYDSDKRQSSNHNTHSKGNQFKILAENNLDFDNDGPSDITTTANTGPVDEKSGSRVNKVNVAKSHINSAAKKKNTDREGRIDEVARNIKLADYKNTDRNKGTVIGETDNMNAVNQLNYKDLFTSPTEVQDFQSHSGGTSNNLIKASTNSVNTDRELEADDQFDEKYETELENSEYIGKNNFKKREKEQFSSPDNNVLYEAEGNEENLYDF